MRLPRFGMAARGGSGGPGGHGGPGSPAGAPRWELPRLVRYRAGDGPVGLAELISPLRYDVLVRARFLELLGERLDRGGDLDGAVREGLAHPYHTWFTTIALPRYRPRDAVSEPRRQAAFRQRVLRSAALLASFRRHGFDPRYPVTLSPAVPGAATDSGKVVPRRLYPLDGCHRLALLLVTGHGTLDPAWYRVRTEPLSAPIDNTHALLRTLPIDPVDYYRFLSLGYAGARLCDRASLLRDVAARRPDRLAELERVLEIDERALGTPFESPCRGESR